MEKRQTTPARWPTTPARWPKLARQPSDRERLSWLLAFMGRSIAKMKRNELGKALRDVGRYLHVLAHWGVRSHVLMASLPADDRLALLHGDLDTTGRVDMARHLLNDLQLALRAGLDALHPDSAFDSEGEPTEGVWRPFAAGQLAPRWVMMPAGFGTLYRVYEGTWMQVSIASAADLLMRWWPQLRRCALDSCHTWFLPTHGRQRYHTPKCSQTARYEKFKPTRDYAKEEARRAELERRRELARKKGKGTR